MGECLYGALQVMGIFVITGGLMAAGYGIWVAIKETRKKP